MTPWWFRSWRFALYIYKPIRLFVLVLAPALACAQGPLTGSPVTGNVRPISLRSETEATNVMLGTISASAAVDDNNNNSISDPIVGEQYFLAPSLAIQQTHSHLKWNMSYRPGLRIYVPRSSLPDQFSQLFGGTLHYDITKRLAIGLRQDYLRTNDPFERLGEAPLQPGIGLLDQPATVALPNARRTSLLSEIESDYRLAKHTYLGLAGHFMQLHFDGLGPKKIGLINTRDTTGSAFLTHQFTARQSAGIQYQFLNMVFPQGDSRTTSHGLLLFDQIAITAHMSFSIFAGPEYSRIHNQELINVFGTVIRIPMSKTLWSPAAGATLDWSGDRLGLQASFVRQVSDGGGLQGSVEMTNATLHIKRKLARRWAAHLEGEMTHDALLKVSGGVKMQTLELGAGISHELASNMRIRLSYQRMHRTGGYVSALPFGNHNRVTLALERDFSLPLGR
jgi:hypothetical protein